MLFCNRRCSRMFYFSYGTVNAYYGNKQMNTEFPPVEIQNLGLCLNEKWIHHDINLTVSRGEILAIVGKSGSGKTTLLRQILQLQKPTTGTVKIFGVDVFHAKEKELY